MEAFVYCWTDLGTNKLYVGVHKGTPDDGYVCSSKLMLQEYKKRPQEFSREILASGPFKEMYVFETAILKSAKADKDPRFYNRHVNNGMIRSLGEPHTEEWKQNHSNTMKAIFGTKERKEEMSRRMMGKRYRLGVKDSSATKQKKRNMRLGKVWSEETKERIRVANSKCWKVTSPSGKSENIRNLSAYCRTYKLSIPHMSFRGKTKGYLCERVVA